MADAAAAVAAAAECGSVAAAVQLAATCHIDDDHVHARVHSEMDVLTRRAAQLDASLGEADGSDSEGEGM